MIKKDLSSSVTFIYASENALLLTWSEKISPVQHRLIIRCQQLIQQQLGNIIIETVASYHSLMIYYKFELCTIGQLEQQIKNIIDREMLNLQTEPLLPIKKIIEIPVYYGRDAGWDLAELANSLSLSINEIICLHQTRIYRAYALGFTPGFCYLGTLDDNLQQARRATPRALVPKGAVAIAGKQTAVYPDAGPGGWHIIGQTPLALYQTVEVSAEHSQQSFLPLISVGQQVCFKAINYQEFCQLGGVLSLAETSPLK